MKEDQKFVMTGISQVKIRKKWVWWSVFVIMLFFVIAGAMLWISATSRPVTVNTGGYTNGDKW